MEFQFEPSLPIQVSAAVTKFRDRTETRRNPKAIAAVKAECRALADAGTWLESTVTEKQDLISWAQQSKTKIHMGELMSICSVKFSESIYPEPFE